MKLTDIVGSAGGLVGCSVPTVGGLACSATATSTPTGLSFSNKGNLEKFNGGICVDTLLSPKEKQLLKTNGEKKTDWKSQDKFKSSGGQSKGCLAVSWDKQTWSNNYWKGVIRYEWLFSKGTEAVVVHGFINSEDTGIQNENWKATYINTTGDRKEWMLWNKTVSSDADLKTKMPKRPSFFSGSGDYWSFKPDYKKKCTGTNCVGNPWKSYFESTWRWKGQNSGNHKFSDWASNYSDVFNEHLEGLKDVVGEKGSWESL